VDILLIIPILVGADSFCVDLSLDKLCWNELVLVFRFMRGSGSGSNGGKGDVSESLPRIGSGDGCMELLFVSTSDFADNTGEICCGLEVIDELVTAE
jgi:hypothetical protein